MYYKCQKFILVEIYRLFEEEEARVVVRQAKVDDIIETSETTWEDVANSHLHRRTARAKIIPYTYLVK